MAALRQHRHKVSCWLDHQCKIEYITSSVYLVHMFFAFLISAFVFSYDSKRKGKFWGLKNSIFLSEMMQFRVISRTGEAVQGIL